MAVEGWPRARPTCTATRAGRGGWRARALLSPFDSLVFERERTERAVRLPLPPRDLRAGRRSASTATTSCPFLLGDRLVGRVDLKADRAAGVLRVQAAHAEDDAPEHTAEELAAELRRAGGAGSDSSRVAVAKRGNLAGPLSRLT